MAVKYTQAPISELICGIVFNTNLLLQKMVLFDLLVVLEKEYPIINTHPVFGEEDVVNGLIKTAQNYEKAGFSSYRLSSVDNKWQVILQQDILTFHWVRQDGESVGSYPGFTVIFNKFISIYELIKQKITDVEKHIKCYYLNYTDRVNLKEYITDEITFFDIINIPTPSFYSNGKSYRYDNFLNRYSVFCEEIKGYSIIGLNTPTLPIGQLLIVENKLKGFNGDVIELWFKKAHDIQTSFFETIFTQKILKIWK